MRPGDGRAIPTFIRQTLAGEPVTVTGNGQQTRSICYVDDTIDGIFALAGSAHPGPINIGSEHEMTMLQIAAMIRDIAGSASPIQFIPRPADDPSVRRPDTTRARDLLRWEANVQPAEGLKRTIAWFADHMRLCSSCRTRCNGVSGEGRAAAALLAHVLAAGLSVATQGRGQPAARTRTRCRTTSPPLGLAATGPWLS
jgi:dTDP-D-glucose 4,6-dehydratase